MQQAFLHAFPVTEIMSYIYQKRTNFIIYSSSDSLEEEKLLKLSLICLITMFSMYSHSFKQLRITILSLFGSKT